MPTNVYFSQKVKSEQDLYEDIVIESLKLYGQDVYYLPREIIDRDMILNEDIESRFSKAYTVEMYIENTDGFEGEGELYSKFGIQIRDQATFIVSRRRFSQLVNTDNNTLEYSRPREGDLIYLPMSTSLFEIKFVDDKHPFFQLSKIPTYKLQCELFEMSTEEIDVNLNNTNQLQVDINTAVVSIYVEVSLNDGPLFNVGMHVKQEIAESSGIYVEAIVSKIEFATTCYRIYLKNISTTDGNFYMFSENSATDTWANLQDEDETISARIIGFRDIDSDEGDTITSTDPEAQNNQFELEADDILDFSVDNPFGDPSEV